MPVLLELDLADNIYIKAKVYSVLELQASVQVSRYLCRRGVPPLG